MRGSLFGQRQRLLLRLGGWGRGVGQREVGGSATGRWRITTKAHNMIILYGSRAIYFIFIYCSRVKAHSKINISIMYTKRKANNVPERKECNAETFSANARALLFPCRSFFMGCMQKNNLKVNESERRTTTKCTNNQTHTHGAEQSKQKKTNKKKTDAGAHWLRAYEAAIRWPIGDGIVTFFGFLIANNFAVPQGLTPCITSSCTFSASTRRSARSTNGAQYIFIYVCAVIV